MDLPVVFDRRPWGLVVVSGPDATSFLQAIVSQDLDPVGVGETVASLLLRPQGKLEVAFRATRWAAGDDGDEWWLDTEPHMAERLAAGLSRFKIRVKVEIEDRTAATALVSVVGAQADAPSGAVAIPARWGSVEGVDLVGPADDVVAGIAEMGPRVGTTRELEVLRIASGIPQQGVDVDESTIPQEAFLERDAVSFTKGCFIGQELVCRIDTRGHVNRFLRRLTLPGGDVPPPGAEVVVGEKVVGAVTSAARVPDDDEIVALAMVRREIEPPTEVVVRMGDTEVAARVVA
jgi:hypothetical protein